MPDNTTFQIVTNESDAQKNNLPSGHATSARRQQTLNQDIVVKEINEETGRFSVKKEDRAQWWMNSQKKSKEISDEIRAKNNPAYFVPKTYISHGKVYEDFATGVRWRDAWKDMTPDDKRWAFSVLAEFINDMSELRPCKIDTSNRALSTLPIKGPDDLAKFLGRIDDKYMSVADKELIQEIYEYLVQTPEHQMMVFGHNDLHGDNIIVDLENRRLAIIDFECSGYKTAFATMYARAMYAFPEFWEYINKLPRAQNPDLTWGFRKEHHDLYNFLDWGYRAIAIYGNEPKSMAYEIKVECAKARVLFKRVKEENTKSKNSESKMTPVPMSHYERE